MMANWDKLNSEYYTLIESFQDSDWEKWENTRSARKEMRRLDLVLKAKIQEEKLKLAALSSLNNETFSQIVVSTASVNLTTPILLQQVLQAGENNYPLAA